MKTNSFLVIVSVVALALGAAGCVSKAPADASKPKRPASSGVPRDPMAPLDNPAVGSATCRGRSAVC